MLRKNSRLIFILFLLFYSPTQTVGQKTIAKIDFGSIEGTTYTNRYFGLKLTIPENWQIQDDETKKKMMESGKRKIMGGDKQVEKTLDTSLLNTLNLLAVFKYPVGSGMRHNPSFGCVAEKITRFPSLTARDYLIGTKSFMQKSQVPYTFREIYSRSIGGRGFVVLPAQAPLNGAIVYQNYYTRIMKGYALVFIITYSTDEELRPLEEMLKSVRFGG